MKLGDLLIIVFASIIGIISTIGTIADTGYISGFYHFGGFLGVFLVWCCIGYACMWTYRKIRDRNATPAPVVPEVKA